MDDLVAFLRARLDEDEAVARNAAVLPHGAAEWHAGAEGSVFAPAPSQLHVRGAILSLDDIGAHIARWDPARVLAEVDAKRKLLDLHQPFTRSFGEQHVQCDHCADLCHSQSGLGCDTPVDAMWPCETARLLALPYAEHPDYREEWRP